LTFILSQANNQRKSNQVVLEPGNVVRACSLRTYFYAIIVLALEGSTTGLVIGVGLTWLIALTFASVGGVLDALSWMLCCCLGLLCWRLFDHDSLYFWMA
jgi:hypothetical protein